MLIIQVFNNIKFLNKKFFKNNIWIVKYKDRKKLIIKNIKYKKKL